jgi:hypothetical protein
LYVAYQNYDVLPGSPCEPFDLHPFSALDLAPGAIAGSNGKSPVAQWRFLHGKIIGKSPITGVHAFSIAMSNV